MRTSWRTPPDGERRCRAPLVPRRAGAGGSLRRGRAEQRGSERRGAAGAPEHRRCHHRRSDGPLSTGSDAVHPPRGRKPGTELPTPWSPPRCAAPRAPASSPASTRTTTAPGTIRDLRPPGQPPGLVAARRRLPHRDGRQVPQPVREGASNPTKPAPGWDQWRMLMEPLSYYDYDVAVNGRAGAPRPRPQRLPTTYLNREAVELVKRWAPSEEAVLPLVSPHAPHDEKIGSRRPCGGRAVPAPGDQDLFARAELPAAASFNEARHLRQAGFIAALPRLERGEVQGARDTSTAAAAGVAARGRPGRQGHRARAAPEERAGRTIIVFASDNGLFHGEHRLRDGKRLAYAEASTCRSLCGSPPRARRATVGRVTQPVANIDLAPTLLELAGADPCAGGRCQVMDGRSMVPLLRGDSGPGRPTGARLLEMRNCHFTGLLGGGEMVVHTLHPPTARTQLGCINRDAYERYDLGRDPFQLRNRAESARTFPGRCAAPEPARRTATASRGATRCRPPGSPTASRPLLARLPGAGPRRRCPSPRPGRSGQRTSTVALVSSPSPK